MKYIQCVLTGMLLLLGIPCGAKNNEEINTKKRPKLNISISIPNYRSSAFNLGILSDFDDVKGAGINVITATTRHNLYGVMVSGGSNFARGRVSGVQIGGISNITSGRCAGLQASGIMNMSTSEMKGAQLSCMMNVNSEQFAGFQLSGISNVAVDFVGFQMSSILNVTQNNLKGLQLGCCNYATELRGMQFGFLNLCGGDVHGVQIGVVNYSKDTDAHKYGLVNVTPNTRIQYLIFSGNMSKSNMAVRFKNNWSYTMLGIGTHYLNLNRKFSGCVFYRFGLYYPFAKRWEVSGDLGYFHVENFKNVDVTTPYCMYSLQARVNLEFRLHKKVGIFASGGYGTTRHYNQNKCFERKPIGELGLVFF